MIGFVRLLASASFLAVNCSAVGAACETPAAVAQVHNAWSSVTEMTGAVYQTGETAEYRGNAIGGYDWKLVEDGVTSFVLGADEPLYKRYDFLNRRTVSGSAPFKMAEYFSLVGIFPGCVDLAPREKLHYAPLHSKSNLEKVRIEKGVQNGHNVLQVWNGSSVVRTLDAEDLTPLSYTMFGESGKPHLQASFCKFIAVPGTSVKMPTEIVVETRNNYRRHLRLSNVAFTKPANVAQLRSDGGWVPQRFPERITE